MGFLENGKCPFNIFYCLHNHQKMPRYFNSGFKMNGVLGENAEGNDSVGCHNVGQLYHKGSAAGRWHMGENGIELKPLGE